MGLKQTLNDNPKLAGVGSVVAVILVIAWLRHATPTNGFTPPHTNGPLAYYTTDEGKTLFTDAGNRVTPFDADGKPACRAVVFKCDGGEQWVQFLEEDSPSGDGMMVKRPGETTWTDARDPRAVAIRKPSCAKGAIAKPLLPNSPSP